MIDPTDAQLSAWGRAIVARRWAKRHEETCLVCGKTFQAKSGQNYCSASCRNHAVYLRRRQLVGPREATCPICGTTFVARPAQLYDKKECAKLAWAATVKAGRAKREKEEAPA